MSPSRPQNKPILNLSSYKLNIAETNVLLKGLSYIPDNSHEIINNVDQNLSNIINRCGHDDLKVLLNSKDIHNQIMAELRTSAKQNNSSKMSYGDCSSVKCLRNNKNIIISKADKGNCAVILDKNLYSEECFNQLIVAL